MPMKRTDEFNIANTGKSKCEAELIIAEEEKAKRADESMKGNKERS